VDDQLVVADAGVEVRELGEAVDDRPGDERQVGEAEALGGLPVVLDRDRGWRRRWRSRPRPR
jgi:hypothetical protein